MKSDALPNPATPRPARGEPRPPAVIRWFVRPLGRVASVPYRLYFGLLRRLPELQAGWLSRAVYAQLYRLVGRRRTRNVRRALPAAEWPAARLREFHRGHLRFQARHALDIARLRELPPAALVRQVRLNGEEHLRAALAAGRGVLLVGCHLGNWLYVTARLGAAGYAISNVANRMPVPGLQADLDAVRRRFGVRTTLLGGGGAQAAAAAFARNEIFCTLIDVALRARHRAEVPFGRAALAVDLGPARLALQHEVPVLLAWSHYADDGAAHVTLRPAPPLPEDGGRAPENLTRLWVGELFREILQRPEQWWCWSTLNLGEGSVPREGEGARRGVCGEAFTS